MASQKRIAKVGSTEQLRSCFKASSGLTDTWQELNECTQEPPDGMRVNLADESSIYKWEVIINGPEQSPYVVSPPHQYLAAFPITRS